MKKFVYKLILSYRGSDYHGWQNQTTQPETIQNHVEKVIRKIVNYQQPCQVIGASRTDSGVHASGQVLKIILPREISPAKLTRGMNSKLPQNIRVVSSHFSEEELNVNRNSKLKEYHYYFTINQSENAISSEIIYPYPTSLDLELIEQACKRIQGEHNFISFCTPGPKPPRPRREIFHCSIESTNLLAIKNDVYYLRIQGNGFLRYMVRYLMGALWDIGSHKMSLEELSLSLETGDKHGVRTKAPAQGLHLIEIKY